MPCFSWGLRRFVVLRCAAFSEVTRLRRAFSYRRTDGILKDALPWLFTAAFFGATVCGICEKTRLRRAFSYRAVAQLVARLVRDQEVAGSTPACPKLFPQ